MNNALKQVMTDTFYQSRKKIAYDLNVNYETPKKYIDQLVYYGYLEVVKTRENNKFSNNLYVLIRKEKRSQTSNAGALNWRR